MACCRACLDRLCASACEPGAAVLGPLLNLSLCVTSFVFLVVAFAPLSSRPLTASSFRLMAMANPFMQSLTLKRSAKSSNLRRTSRSLKPPLLLLLLLLLRPLLFDSKPSHLNAELTRGYLDLDYKLRQLLASFTVVHRFEESSEDQVQSRWNGSFDDLLRASGADGVHAPR
ncbi:unnamed protein product [Symbiodinium sp. CCMP2592]|nr:unnamed protein product [Symbiodinium sp. CCMP2592]